MNKRIRKVGKIVKNVKWFMGSFSLRSKITRKKIYRAIVERSEKEPVLECQSRISYADN
jgi:hypothetical protein